MRTASVLSRGGSDPIGFGTSGFFLRLKWPWHCFQAGDSVPRFHGFRFRLAVELLAAAERPDVLCCNAALRSCDKAAQWQVTLQVFEQMQETKKPGASPDPQRLSLPFAEMIFSLLVLKGIYHYVKYVLFFQGS